ncbi:3-oxoacyl-ACP synthase [Maribacter sp. CXY002]|uniref:3-oxoacyl-ACP synthase n=1 Tax=Maribacter luteocoastalis TaxID=3407671 RepID=UPI003B674FBE
MKKINDFIELKLGAHQHCSLFVSSRWDRIHQQIKELEVALTTETKSSAGDKHETGRAMIQLEREKLGRQLAEVEKMQQVMSKIGVQMPTHKIGLGNLVITNTFNYYIAISSGEFKLKDTSVFCISGGTPIGKLLLGKSVGDEFSFNQTTSSIVAIY